jgi:O-antigen ligase
MERLGRHFRWIGLAMLALALLTGRELFCVTMCGWSYLLALLAFAGVSIGLALTALGPHLLDEVELAERWRPFGPR